MHSVLLLHRGGSSAAAPITPCCRWCAGLKALKGPDDPDATHPSGMSSILFLQRSDCSVFPRYILKIFPRGIFEPSSLEAGRQTGSKEHYDANEETSKESINQSINQWYTPHSLQHGMAHLAQTCTGWDSMDWKLLTVEKLLVWAQKSSTSTSWETLA